MLFYGEVIQVSEVSMLRTLAPQISQCSMDVAQAHLFLHDHNQSLLCYSTAAQLSYIMRKW